MHFFYNSQLRELAREQRKSPTETEKIMWEEVLMNDQLGYRFLRQKPILNFILDFYCSKLKLAIEIDGSSHVDKQEYDELRTIELEKLGIEVLRFDNVKILNELENVRNVLSEKICEIEGFLKSPNPLSVKGAR